MTEKDRIIQKQSTRIALLERELQLIVESCQICRYCKYLDADCSPATTTCHPKWRGAP